MAGRVICIQADSSRNRAVAVPSHSSEWRCSLRRLRLADCEGLAESALCSLTGHDELETLDLSRSTQALTGATVAALQQLKGESAQDENLSCLQHAYGSAHVWLACGTLWSDKQSQLAVAAVR